MPVEFEYNQSTEQAFYFILDATIDGVPIEEGDWIAAFKGNICVGSRQWIGSYTDIPVMGDDGEEYSAGYMLPGEYPTFRVYKLSDSSIFNAHPSQNVGFPQGLLAFFEIQSLDVIHDCANVLGGFSVVDNCGVCDDDSSNDCANDCMNVWGGEAFIDDCGICSGGTSGHEANSDKDFCGVCFGNGENEQGCGCFLPPAEEYWFDEDGDGFGSGESQEYCYADLPPYWVDNGIDPEPSCSNPNADTLMIDHCGICAGNGIDDLGCGCFIPAALEYWYDSDGDGLGSGDSEYFCEANLLENWVTNNDDLEPNCSTNNTDDCGICGGDGSDDLGCGCFNPAELEYWYDVDGDGFGFGEPEAYCLQDVPENWVTNHVDIEEFCWNPDPVTPMIDECGICDGGGSDDLGCGCFNPAALEYWYDSDGDGLGFGDSEEFCLQNIPDNWVLNNNDTEPYCSTNDIDHCGVCGGGGSDDLGCGCFNPAALEYWYDSDGDGLGSGDSIEFCLEDLLDNWVLNGDDAYPDCFDNFYDDCDVCGGDGSADLGCGCFNPAALEYWYDSDGDGLGSGDSEYFCEDDVLENWVTNNEDLEPDCETNNTDQCGVCFGDNSTCADCNDEPYGLAFLDECNNCVEGSTGLEENYADQGCGCNIPAAMTYCEDTDGDNFGNPGTEFEFCISEVPDNWVLNCSDPEPECSTNDIDHCGVCGGGGSDDLGCGCFNPSALEYWYDSDGDGLGSGDYEVFCLENIPENWVSNNDDEYPNCSDNFYDDCGICGGDGSDDLGCGCFEPAAIIYCEDSDSDGYGSPDTETEFCLSEIPENWVIDCSDPYPNCDGVVDHCDVCNGNGLDDVGCGCFEAAPLQYCYDADGDGLGAGSSVEYCAIDVLDDWVIDCSDLEPFCETNNTDDCNVCGGDNSSCSGCTDENAWNYCIDCTIEDGSCIFTPEEFNFYQSTAQAFYFVIDADILDVPLNELEDWIGVFNGDVCVGARPWEGSYTSAPAMGNDGSEWTTGYLQEGDYPTFKIFDASENRYFETEAINIYLQGQFSLREYNGWEDFGFFEIEKLRARVHDCANVIDGDAYIDDCGECVGGTTDAEDSWAKDCNGDCFGGAFIDSCGICSEGNTGHSSDSDNLGCGCFNLGPEEYWYDQDNDGLGSGGSVSLCLDDVSEVWVQNSDDLEPFCSTNDTDECGVCAGNNSDMDCAGICFGASLINECGECSDSETSCLVPVANAQTIELFEDMSSQIILFNYDEDAPPIIDYTIITHPLNGSLTGEFPNLFYTPNINFNGEDNFLFTISTDEFTSDPAIISLTILPVNDSPVVYDIQEGLEEGQSIEFQLIGFDIDGDELSYEISSGPDEGQAELVGNNLIYTPNENYYGFDSFTFIANDGQINSNIGTVLLTINNMNDLPVIESIADQEIFENESLVLNINASDEEGDELIFSATVDDNASVIVNGSELSIIPDYNYNGVIVISVSVSDGSGLVTEEFSLTVLPVNSAPEISIINDIIIDEDNSTTFRIIATDIDGDQLTYSAYGLDLSFEFDNDLVTVHPNDNLSGVIEVTAIAADSELQASTTFNLIINEVNDAPEIISDIEDLELNQNGDDYIIDLNEHFYDVENGNNLEYSIFENHPAIVASVENNNLILSIVENIVSSGSITITASDNISREVASIDFEVDVIAVNQPPVVNDMTLTSDEDSELVFILDASDESSELAVSVISGPSNGEIVDISSLEIVYLSDENYFGTDEIIFSISDGELSSELTVNINIEPINDAPIVSDVVFEVSENEFQFDLSDYVFDLDGDELIFVSIPPSDTDTLVTVFGGIVIPLGDNLFTYEHPDGSYDADFLLYKVNDGLSESPVSMITFNLYNRSWSRNNPPLAFDDEVNTLEDNPVELSLLGFDVFNQFPQDGSESLYITQSPEFGSLGEIQFIPGSTAQFAKWIVEYIPEDNFSGTDEIRFTVQNPNNENGESEEAIISINISDVNDIPIADNQSHELIEDGVKLIFPSGSDIESTQLTFTIFDEPSHGIVSVTGGIFTYEPNGNFNGEDSFTYVANDGEDLSQPAIVELYIAPINDAPIFNDLASINLDEDSNIDIVLSASDIDGDLLAFSIIDTESQIGATLIANVLSISPTLNYNGNGTVLLGVTDGEYQATQSIIINVNPVNDSPLIDEVDDITVNEGESTTLEFPEYDIDGDVLTYSVDTDVDAITNIIGNLITISPSDEDYNGSINVLITATDGSLQDSHNFILTYSPINDIPQITSIPDGDILEDTVFIYALSATDIDGDNIEFSAEVSANGVAEIQGNFVSIIPNQDFNGEINATISASDGEHTVFSSFNIQVLPVNDPPIISTIDTQIASEDTEFQIEIEVDDIDDVDHSFSVFMDTTYINYSINENSIVFQPIENWYGETLVSIAVSDDEFSVTESFIIEFEPVNDSPQIVSDAIIEAYEDLAYEYQIEVADPDNDNFYFSLISSPEGMEISENGLITWLPAEGITSSGLVTIVVWDTSSPISGQDEPAFQQFIINVESVNDAPVITSTPIISAIEDEVYSYQVTASDSDSQYDSSNWCWDWNCLTYTLAVAPEGMTISINGLIEWVPTEGILSSGLVVVNVSDNDDLNPIFVSQEFLVVVAPVNDAPVIVSIADSSATTGEEYTYQVLVEDPDDDIFTYNLFNNPDGMDIDEMGLISWTPEFPGTYGPITLMVSDGGQSDIQPAEELFIVIVESESPLITMEFELLHESNLISFLGIPEDSSLASIFEPLGDNAQGLIGQGVASNNLGNSAWVGSLNTIEPTSGYWLKLDSPPIEPFVVEAYPTDPNQNYELIEGHNIISYVGSDGMSVSEAIPDEYENSFYGIIGQGSATVQLTEGSWVGSLNQFNNLKGYWVQVDEDMDFNWNISDDLVRESPLSVDIQKSIPNEFIFSQSTQQAFYFVKDANVDGYDLLEDDWLIAYHDNTVIGARQWNGEYTDIPAMGIDGFDDTFGYIETGMLPEFKLFRESTGELIDMSSDKIAPWNNNEMTFISLSRKEEIPASVALNPAYPNPFNPSTQISFDIAHEGFINLSIYDINGRLVEVLASDIIKVGSHSLIWNAQSYASGIYFVHLITENISLSQKLILVK